MRRHLGIFWIAVFFALLFSDLSLVKAKTTRQRNKSNRKGLQTNRTNPTTVQPSEKPQGAFIRNGRKLIIDFGEEGNSYYATHYPLFPDEIHYAGCAESNVTREVFIGNCVNATRIINKLEPLEEQNISDIYSRILEQLIKELCALNYCEFRTERGTGLRLSLDQYVIVYLVILTCLIVK